MTRDEALQALDSEDSDTRLRGARALGQLAEPTDLVKLRSRARAESVPWIISALERAIAQATKGPGVRQMLAVEELDDGLPTAYLEGVRRTTDRLVHELRTIAGTLYYWAERELADSYPASETRRQLQRLRECLDAVEQVGQAARAGTGDQFDIASLVGDEIAATEYKDESVGRIGPSPHLVWGERGTLALVLRNALKNAIEACSPSKVEVHVTWGETPEEYWIAVFNRGSGLPDDAEPLFDFGRSTKEGHVGAGLAIAAEAALAMGGTVALADQADGTTKFEFRWPRPDQS